MEYIVLDMEWNDTSPKTENKDGCRLNHEIIQIGAVKIDEEHRITDTFFVNIKPRIYKRIRAGVTELTGITADQLENGVDIEKAVSAFAEWCGNSGGDFIFLTWGADDIPVLLNNLEFFGLDQSWIPFYFNAQVLFNMQTGNRGQAYSLEYAVEYFGIKAEDKMHNALNDASYTAQICSGFDIEDGIIESEEYDGSEFGTIDVPNKEEREISFSFKSLHEALENGFGVPRCPKCGRKLERLIWYRVNDNKIIADGYCALHDDYAVVIRNKRLSKKTVKTIKSTYAVNRINEAYFDIMEERAEEAEIWL